MSCPTCSNSEGEGPGIVTHYFKGQEQYRHKCSDPWHTSAPPAPAQFSIGYGGAYKCSICGLQNTNDNPCEHWVAATEPVPPAPAAPESNESAEFSYQLLSKSIVPEEIPSVDKITGAPAAQETAESGLYYARVWSNIPSKSDHNDYMKFAESYADSKSFFHRAEVARLEKELGEARSEMSTCDDIKLDQPLANCIADLQRERARLEKERDLAIAHDRQPYPTAEAYEKVCELLHRTEKERDAYLLQISLSNEATRKEREGLPQLLRDLIKLTKLSHPLVDLVHDPQVCAICRAEAHIRELEGGK